MKKISKKDLARRDELADAMDAARVDVENTVVTFNVGWAEAWSDVETALDKLRAAVEKAKAWAEEMAANITAYVDERSDTWRDGAGQAYDSWKDALEDFDPEVELDEPDELEVPDMDFVEDFRDIPTEP